MKGVVFNLLEEAVTQDFGADAWDDLIDEAGVSGIYSSLGNYSDDDIAALVSAASVKLSLTPSAVLQWFGRKAMPLLKERYNALFANHSRSRDFILSVNSVIHPEVRKLYAGASCPFFHFRESGDGALVVRYDSTRSLIDLAHGFVLGAADLWGETVDIGRGAPGTNESNTLTIRWMQCALAA